MHFAVRTLLLTLLCTGVALSAPPEGQPTPNTPHGLAGPYIDERQLTALPFGAHSQWLQPWRAYQETIPAHRFLAALGINLNLSDADNADLLVRMLAEHGIRSARVEIGWGQVNYADETKLNGADRFRRTLAACKKYHTRPLILLNANSGVPCPMNQYRRALAKKASKGDRTVELTDTRNLIPGYSGLASLTDYRADECIFTALNGNTAILSRPLPKDLGEAGQQVNITTLKYRPFAAPGTDDFHHTMEGWKQYVGTVSRFVADALGTRGQPDVGFDVEIWNELTFGSAFLSLNNYYDPIPVKYSEQSIWTNLVAETAAYADAHPDDFRGAVLVDGFRNTIPWPASSREPARVGAMSAHPYPPRKTYPQDETKGTSVNALFAEDTSGFKPAYRALFPEYYGTALQTETTIRDMAPFTTPIYDVQHGRNARSIGGKPAPCPLWLTEIGLEPAENGIKDPKEALRFKARTTARFACFFAGKGVPQIDFFAALGGDTGFGLIQDNFVTYARSHTDYPAADTPYVSPVLRTLGNLTAKLSEGLDPKLTETRPLTVTAITDTHNHAQFEGDGSPAHPSLYDRELLALFPIQVNATRFVIPYYVMTRDVLKEMSPEEFTVTLHGVDGRKATIMAYDPLTGATVPVTKQPAPPGELRVTLTAADYPRLLTVQEAIPR